MPSLWGLAFKGVLEGDKAEVRKQARFYAEEEQYIYAVLFLSMINDPKADELLEQALLEPAWPLLGWALTTPAMSPEQRKYPVFIQLENHLGITAEWRLYLCQRANQLPASTGITCDESKYVR